LIARRLLTRAQLDKAIERQMADQYGIVEWENEPWINKIIDLVITVQNKLKATGFYS
jgi:hypothetical protein